MTLILRDSKLIDFHTDLYEIIEPFEKEFTKLNWLLTNQDYTLLDYEQKGIVEKLDHESKKIEFTGPELLEIIKNREIQFIWGVFCGFKGGIPKLDDNELPYADMNSNIWDKPRKFLNKDSTIEIICFDSSYTIIKSKDKNVEKLFLKKFIDATKLK